MKALRPLLAVLLVAAGVAAVVLVARRGTVQPSQPGEAPPPTPTPVPGKLVLFFPGDDTFLHRERRDVPELPTTTPARIRLVVEELLAGSREGFASPFSWAATVQAVFVDSRGNAFIDLSAPPADSVSGSAAEEALIWAAVNSVVANCAAVDRVQLLFGGKELSTLGHIDLARPLAPRPELVAP